MTEDLHVSDASLTLMHPTPGFEITPRGDPAAHLMADADTMPKEAEMHESQDFIDPAAWDEARDYGDGPCQYIRYNLMCKAAVNKKRVRTDTKEDMVLSPVAYGEICWQGRMRTVEKKRSHEDRLLELKNIVVKVVVAERGVDDYINEFDVAQEAWSAAAKQLAKWWARYRGKRLKLEVSFNYVETSEIMSEQQARNGRKGTATRKMFAARDAHLAAEQESLGRPPDWPDVYELFRCTKSSKGCGRYCMVLRNVHFPLKTRHLQRLVEHKQKGGKLESHADVPKGIREQLRAEHDKRHNKKNYVHVNVDETTEEVTLVNPASVAGSSRVKCEAGLSSEDVLDDLGLADQDLDDSLCDYGKWQKSRSLKRLWQEACEKAEDVWRANALDLGQIAQQKSEFYTDRGVPCGMADRWVRDVPYWAKRQKSCSDPAWAPTS